MLLLTDRLAESSGLQTSLGTVEPCIVAALHQTPEQLDPHSLLVCDLALDNIATTELIHAALTHYRSVADDAPILCLTRDPSQATFAQARAIGATAILPSNTHPAELAARVRQLISARPPRRAGAVPIVLIENRVHEAGSTLSTMFEAAHRGGTIFVDALSRGGDAVVEAIGRARIRAWLDVVWRYDDVTYQHCLLVAGLTSAFARGLGLSLDSQRLLSQAALVHDIGKAHIPHAILTKQGPLSVAEISVMRTHVTVGHDMLARQVGFEPGLLDIVRHHHEYIDGSGYPDGLRGGEISQFVRIVTICDIYAAMIERRSYKKPSPPETAFAAILAMGERLDAGLVSAFHGIVKAT